MRLTEENWNSFFHFCPQLMCLAGGDGYFLKVNKAMVEALGYAEEELLSRPIIDFVVPEDVSATAGELEKLVAGGETISFDNRYRCSDGSLLNLRWCSSYDADTGLIFGAARDITAQVHQERELRAFRKTLDQIHDCIIFCDFDTLQIFYVNQGAIAHLGYTEEELLKMTPLDIKPDFNEARLRRKMETLRSGRAGSVSFETRHRTADGKLVPVSVTYQHLLTFERAILVAIVRDIRQQKREEAFRSAILNAVDDIIVTLDGAGVVQTCNHAVERVLGYPVQDVVGQQLSMLMEDPAIRLKDSGFQAKGVESGVLGAGREVVGRRKDGSSVPLLMRLSLMKFVSDSEQVFYLGVLQDLTEQKHAEEELAKKHRELAAVAKVDRMFTQMMVALNEESHDVSSAGAALLRVLSTQADLRPLALYLHDEASATLTRTSSVGVSEDLQEVYAIGEGLVGEAAERRTAIFLSPRGGRTFSLQTGLGPMNLASVFALPLVCREKLLGVLSGASLAPLDKREENSMVQMASQFAISLQATRQREELSLLAKKLSDRTRETIKTNRELERANRMKSEFLASMSHELRTPLNAIIGFSEILKDGLLGELGERQLDYVSEIFQSGRHLLSLINDILDLSKIEAGKMDLELETVSLESLVSNGLTLVKGQAAARGVTLSHHLQTGLESLEADARKLRQIVYNLLSNAVKFTDSGGNVKLEVISAGESVEIGVIDTGIGVSPEDQTRLFQPFVQLDSGIDRRYEGTGLGLVMVKRLVELHGGSCGVSSTKGQGSRFWVRLPRQPKPLEIVPVAPVRPHGGSTVLVVDDDPSAVVLATEWLEQEGIYVYSASDCESAWDLMEREAPDAILLDILFERGSDGWVFLKRVKSDPRTANIPVVVMSIAAEIERGMALGAIDVLTKPVSGAELLRVMKRAVGPLLKGEARHLLIVDDDPLVLEQLTTRLESEGFRVTPAEGGDQALSAIAQGDVDLVILDLLMPEMCGFEVVRRLQADPEAAHIPVVVLTAKTLTAEEEDNLRSGVRALMTKQEWDKERFLAIVRESLSGPIETAGVSPSQESPSTLELRRESFLDSVKSGLSGVEKPTPYVLLVEDDPQAVRLLTSYLSDGSFELGIVTGGRQALESFADRPPDLLVLDLILPDLSGFEVLKRIRSQSADLPIVVLTAVNLTAKEEETLARDCQAVFLKASTGRFELVQTMKELLKEPS